MLQAAAPSQREDADAPSQSVRMLKSLDARIAEFLAERLPSGQLDPGVAPWRRGRCCHRYRAKTLRFNNYDGTGTGMVLFLRSCQEDLLECRRICEDDYTMRKAIADKNGAGLSGRKTRSFG